MVRDLKKKFRVFALANGFEVPKFLEDDPEDMDDENRLLSNYEKGGKGTNKQHIERIYVIIIINS